MAKQRLKPSMSSAQLYEQQSRSVSQTSKTGLHQDGEKQKPSPPQVRAQHWAAKEHGSPAARHSDSGLQVSVAGSQTAEQHSESVAQPSPAVWRGAPPPSQLPCAQVPEQQL